MSLRLLSKAEESKGRLVSDYTNTKKLSHNGYGKALLFCVLRKLSLSKEFLHLVGGNDGLLEIIGTCLLRTLHSDDLAIGLVQATKCSNIFLCDNS